MKYNTAILSNGLRVIHLPSDSPIVYCGYQIGAGTRHEKTGEEGLAHFVEHMTFKGTTHRNSLKVIDTLESVGGELNAFTNKEDTTYYAAILAKYVGRAVDLLTDIVFHSTYPQQEIDKEREVIVEEIESYNDSPAELIYDEFENLIFGNHPLGHNILGNAENVRRFVSKDAKCFAETHYRTDNAVFFAYGNLDFNKLVRRIHTALKTEEQDHVVRKQTSEVSLEETVLPSPPSCSQAPSLPRSITVSKGTHQAHVMLGTRAYNIHHPDRIALYLLNNMLGGPGLNARLSICLREKHGLVYTVESTMVSYSDTGIWSVYFGCDHDDVKRCLQLVRKELDKLMKSPVSSRKLAAAKLQIKGQIGIACDQRENFALDFGKSFLHYGWEKDIQELYRQIDAVTAEQLQRVANDLFAADHITTLIYQ